MAYLANYGAIALELMFGRCLASPSQWDTRHGAIIRCNRYPLIPLTGVSTSFVLHCTRKSPNQRITVDYVTATREPRLNKSSAGTQGIPLDCMHVPDTLGSRTAEQSYLKYHSCPFVPRPRIGGFHLFQPLAGRSQCSLQRYITLQAHGSLYRGCQGRMHRLNT